MKDVNKIYTKCLNMLSDTGIKTGDVTGVSLKKKGARAWGTCHRYANGTYGIEISISLVQDDVPDVAVETVMLHELLHTCDGCMNHGREWTRLASIINTKYGYEIKRANSYDEYGVCDDDLLAAGYKYKIECADCGWKTYKIRKCGLINHTERYRHCCGGKLVVFALGGN